VNSCGIHLRQGLCQELPVRGHIPHTLETSEKCVHFTPQCPPSGNICEQWTLLTLTGPDLEIHACIISLLYVCTNVVELGVRPAELFTHRQDCAHTFIISNYIETRLYSF
jgi:hypothetical protein